MGAWRESGFVALMSDVAQARTEEGRKEGREPCDSGMHRACAPPIPRTGRALHLWVACFHGLWFMDVGTPGIQSMPPSFSSV